MPLQEQQQAAAALTCPQPMPLEVALVRRLQHCAAKGRLQPVARPAALQRGSHLLQHLGLAPARGQVEAQVQSQVCAPLWLP